RPEAPYHAPLRVNAGRVERLPPVPATAAHTEGRVEQHERRHAPRDPARRDGIPEQEQQRREPRDPEQRQPGRQAPLHCSASDRVNRPSYSARPTIAPARPPSRIWRRSSSEATPPEAITSRPSAAIARAPASTGPASIPSRATSV